MSSQPIDKPVEQRRGLSRSSLIGAGVLGALALFVVVTLSLSAGDDVGALTGGQSALVLALPAFLAGLLSFLSPCTLPILPAYFAFTFNISRGRVVTMGLAFFLGLATTMTLLGASATALSGLLFDNRAALTFWGGVVVIIFGVMGMLGKGFAGPQLQERPAATLAGSYLYGATFALGWTACVGPILGSLLTLLATTSDVAIVQGGVLAFIYAMGLGAPLVLVSTFFNRLGQGSRAWKLLRGRGFDLRLFGRTFYLHSTSLVSGGLMVLMGLLLASGRLELISQQVNGSALASWYADIEASIQSLFVFNR